MAFRYFWHIKHLRSAVLYSEGVLYILWPHPFLSVESIVGNIILFEQKTFCRCQWWHHNTVNRSVGVMRQWITRSVCLHLVWIQVTQIANTINPARKGWEMRIESLTDGLLKPILLHMQLMAIVWSIKCAKAINPFTYTGLLNLIPSHTHLLLYL